MLKLKEKSFYGNRDFDLIRVSQFEALLMKLRSPGCKLYRGLPIEEAIFSLLFKYSKPWLRFNFENKIEKIKILAYQK